MKNLFLWISVSVTTTNGLPLFIATTLAYLEWKYYQDRLELQDKKSRCVCVCVCFFF